MSMPKAVRHINETRAMELLLQRGGLSRADLARELGVTRSTASSIVASMLASGLVMVQEHTDKVEGFVRTGRPSTTISLRPKHSIFLGIDIGVEQLTMSAIDLTGKVIMQESNNYEEPRPSPETVVKMIQHIVSIYISTLSKNEYTRGLAISVPGVIDLCGTVLRAPLLGWKNIPLKKMVQTALPKVNIAKLENDANAFAISDIHLGTEPAANDAIYVFIESGVGGCIISNGQILRGNSGRAAEFGHIIVGENNSSNEVSVPGSWESYIARKAVLSSYENNGGHATSIREILKALEAKDAPSQAMLIDWAHYLGRGLASLISIFDPETIIFGGTLSALFPHAESLIQESVRNHLLSDNIMPTLQVSAMGREAPSIGAALMLHREFFDFDQKLLFGEK